MPPQSSDPRTESAPSDNSPAIKKPQIPVSVEQDKQTMNRWHKGLFWAILSPVFLGITPIFAKIAYGSGVGVLTVVAFRTLFAAAVLWLGMLLFARHYIRSSSPAIMSSMLAGAINGIGSLFFYASLSRIDASLGQLINISYLIFVTILNQYSAN